MRTRADTAIAIIGLGYQFPGAPGLPAHALALEAAGGALADAGFPSGRGLNRDRAGVIIGTTLARPGSGVVRQRTPTAAEGLGNGWPTEVQARAGRPVLTAETMLAATDRDGGAGTIAGRVCAWFGLRGAGHTVDGFRFSALLAVAAACSALAAGDLDFVLAGGVDTGPGPAGPADAGWPDGPAGIRAGDGKPGQDVPAHGCGAVALMRAGDAVAAGAPLYAEITGWGMCADTGEAGVSAFAGGAAGAQATQAGQVRTLPSLVRACRQAGIDPEAERLIIDVGRPRAAGAIAGVLKGAVAVASGSTLAEVTARGLGGGTVNLLLSAPAAGAADVAASAGPAASSVPAAGEAPRPLVYAFSGDDPRALIAALNRIAEIAPDLSGRERRDLARQLGRQHPGGPVRAAFVADGPDELADRARSTAHLLTDLPAGVLRSAAGAYAGCGVRGRVVLLFPGGLEAALAEPPAAGHQEQDAAASEGAVKGTSEGGRGRRGPGSAAAACLSSRGALRWLDRLGVAPAAAVGHGTGELTGLAWAGCISEQDAVRLISERDRIIRGHPRVDTAMLDIAADTATSRRLCAGTDLVIAAYNGPRAHLLAGPAVHVRMVAARAAAEGIATTVILSTHAFHSPAMAACASAFRHALGGIRFAPPRRRLISTITGREIDARDNIPAMLAGQFTAPVRFLEAMRAVARDTDLFCVAGPGHALAGLASECCQLPAVTVPEDTHPGSVTSATAAAALFAAGAVATLDPLLQDGPARPLHSPRDEAAVSVLSGTLCENGQNQPSQDEQCSDDIGRFSGNYGKHPGKGGNGDRTLDRQGASAIPGTAPVPPRSWTMTVQQPIGSEREVNASMPDAPGTAGPPEKAGPWAHCFTEVLHPLGQVGSAGGAGGAVGGGSPGPAGPWRIRVAGRERPEIRITAGEGTAAAPAGGVLCYVADPADPGAADALLAAGEEAAGPGRLVVITHGPGLAGFCQSLRARHPQLGITLIRVPESAAGLRAAGRFAAAEHGTFRELVLSGADPDRPATVSIQPVLWTAPGGAAAAGSRAPAPAVRWRGAAAAPVAGAGITAIGPADAVLVTVGPASTAGTALACAEALGRTGAAVALIGPDHPAGHLQAALDRLRTAGTCAACETADLTDPAATAEAIGRLEERLGRITAVLHASGIGAPSASGRRAGETAGITAAATDGVRAGHAGTGGMDAVLRPVTGALSNVLAAVEHRRLRLVATFGSVAGQYGLPGGERYALASGALRHYAERLRGHLAGCRVLHVDWPLSPGIDAGRMLLRFLTTAGAPDTVIVHGPEASGGIPAGPPPAVQRASRADWLPAELRGRFLESVLAHYPGSELVAEARLSAATDPYLTDYRVDGATELPTVMGLEAMAQAASALAGRPLSRAATITLGAPVVVGQERPAVIRISARNQGDVVEAVLRSAETGYRSDHIRALFPLGPFPQEETRQTHAAARSGDGAEHLLDGMTAGIVDGTELYGPLRFPAGRFRRVAFLPALTSRNCRALLRGTDDKPWFGPGLGPLASAPLLLGSPGVNDAAMHVLQACVPHRKLVPVSCESLSCSGTVVGGAVEVRAAERSAGGGEYVWDAQAVDTDGQPVASWTGLRLRDAGPLPRNEPWSPMLLAVYLERGAAALGLDPDLRITVRAGHPRQAAGIPVRSGGDGPADSAESAAGEAAGASGGTAPHGGERREAVAGIYAIAVGPAASGPPATGSGPQLGSVLYPAAGAGGRARRSHLDGLTLMVDGAFPAACEWEAADGGRNADGGGDWAEKLGAGFGALRTELLERCGEPAALVDARIWTAAQCLSKAGRGGQQPLAGETGAWPGPGDGRDGRWVLLRTGDAAIASTIVGIAGVSAPVAVAIMARAATAAADPAASSRS